MERRAVVGHKNLDAGNPLLGKLGDLVKHAVHDLRYHAVQGKVHTGFVLGPDVDAVVDGVQQARLGVLGGIVHNGGGPAHHNGVGGLIACGVLVPHVAQSGEVGVLVHAAGQHILARSINYLIGGEVQVLPYGPNGLSLHQNITLKFFAGGYNGPALN